MLTVFSVKSHSPAVLLVSVLGSLVVIVALTLYRHQHPLNLYLLFGFVSISKAYFLPYCFVETF